MNFIGVDPGMSGGIAVLDKEGYVLLLDKFKDKTDADLFNLIEQAISFDKENCAMLEAVHSMPREGVVSAFKFGKNFGMLIGMLTAIKMPWEFVTPQKWQKYIGCLTHGDKNISKAMAQRLFPTQKITHATADALLIAEHNRREHTIQTRFIVESRKPTTVIMDPQPLPLVNSQIDE